MSTLVVNNLSIGYRHRTLATSISFVVKSGQALAILGPNGAGKTTLFRTLLGLLDPITGMASIDTQRTDQMPASELAKRIAYVPQNAATLFSLNVVEVVEMARAPHLPWYATPSLADRDLAMQALTQLGIARLADREFSTLSGGERQLVLIARALTSGAQCLLLDEPTASLDFGNRLLIEAELRRLKASGVALIFTTHDPQQARHVSSDLDDKTLTISSDGTVAFGALVAGRVW